MTIFETAGFAEVHLELHIDVRKLAPESWEKILDSTPRPNTPTLREILDTRFTPEERRRSSRRGFARSRRAARRFTATSWLI